MIGRATLLPERPVATGMGRQHPRSSSPRSTVRRWSRPQVPPSEPAIARRKWAQVPQLVLDRRQTQQRAASGCGVRQCGQRQFAMRGW
jgi:hypothetical protein